MVLLTAVTVALVFFMHVPLAALHQNLFASVNGFAFTGVLRQTQDSIEEYRVTTGLANALIDCCPVVAIGGSSPISPAMDAPQKARTASAPRASMSAGRTISP